MKDLEYLIETFPEYAIQENSDKELECSFVPITISQDIIDLFVSRFTRRCEFIAFMCQLYNLKVGAEIGVWKGDTLLTLLDRCPNLFMYGIDAYDNDVKYYETWPMGEIYSQLQKDLLKYDNRVIILVNTSAGASKIMLDDTLDFVFIDGDHTYNAVLQDITLWKPKVKSGGWIMGHDINWVSVKQAVEESFGDNYLVGPDNVWIVKNI